MGLGPGRMDLILFGWEKMAEVGLFMEEVSKAEVGLFMDEVSKAMQELQLLLNILSLTGETMDISISLLVWIKMLILCYG